MIEVLRGAGSPRPRWVGVEQPFDMPLVDLDTGEVLDRALVGTLDLIERDAGRLQLRDHRVALAGLGSPESSVRGEGLGV
jgi:hypothetical protein